MPPRVSALIVNYRSYEETDRCLESLRASSLAPECIVVDHASDEPALARLRRVHPDVRFVATAENPGFGAGINRAATLAQGDLLLVLNPDTVVDTDVVARLTRWMDSHPQTGIAAPLVATSGGAIEASARTFPGWSTVLGGRSTWLSRAWPSNPLSRRNLLTGPDVREPIDVDWVSGACMLIRRDAFDAVSGFDEGFFLYWEDADLCCRVGLAGWRVTYYPGCRVTHRGGRSSRHRAIGSAIAFHRSVFRYYLKHGGRWRFILAPAVFAALHVRLGVELTRSAVSSLHQR
jgi:GT2 family glycosyltransferase